MIRAELAQVDEWKRAFITERKDHRYYELVEDTILQNFDYRYFAIKDPEGALRAIQPFFILDQDLLAGISPRLRDSIRLVRRLWPRFLTVRTLMVGCALGEGQLDGDQSSHCGIAEQLAVEIATHARRLGASLVVLKEFPAKYRDPLNCFLSEGFCRVPSFPMTYLNIDYPDFGTYMTKVLSHATRRKLRKKLSIAAASHPITLSVVTDVTDVVEDIYPLYLQVYRRSKFHFEMLTSEFLSGIGRSMPDKVRFFLWRQCGRIVAFTLCMVHGDSLYAEYIGLDYSVALELHLYHYAVRDMISWAIAMGYKWFRSSGLNYDPKLHMRHLLDPVDLYVRHTSTIANAALRLALPVLEPTRYDPILKRFPNYREIIGAPH